MFEMNGFQNYLTQVEAPIILIHKLFGPIHAVGGLIPTYISMK